MDRFKFTGFLDFMLISPGRIGRVGGGVIRSTYASPLFSPAVELVTDTGDFLVTEAGEYLIAV